MISARNEIQRDAIALFLLINAAYLFLTVALDWRLIEDETRGFLYGVAQRASVPSYSGVMLCGLIAVPIHAAVTLSEGLRRDRVEAYDEFAAWGQLLFTSAGFLGTIVGVSIAVAGLRAAMLSEDPRELVHGLSVAFDTTFLGLTAALVLMILRRILPTAPKHAEREPP